jgi:predicted dehydrogenase
MKFLIIGLGSMGKRRIRNLKILNQNDIIGFDIKSERRTESEKLYNISTFKTIDEAWNENPDAVIISTSPKEHFEYAKKSANKKIPFFTEINTLKIEQMNEIIEIIKKNQTIGIPSCNLRFHPIVKQIKKLIAEEKIGKPLHFNLHSGAYLPDWHPWEKIDNFYVSKRETGGGRDELAWELTWIFWIMGNPKSVFGNTVKLGEFDADILDTYDSLIEFENGSIGHVLVDVISLPFIKTCEIVGTNGMIRWDWNECKIKLYQSDSKKWSEIKESNIIHGYKIEKQKEGFAISENLGLQESYIQEIENFIQIIKNEKKSDYTFDDERNQLTVMYSIEESFETGKKVLLNNL